MQHLNHITSNRITEYSQRGLIFSVCDDFYEYFVATDGFLEWNAVNVD